MVVVALEEKPRQIGNGNKSIVAIFAGKDTINHNPRPLHPLTHSLPLPPPPSPPEAAAAAARNDVQQRGVCLCQQHQQG
jgi:hypothetical protein